MASPPCRGGRRSYSCACCWYMLLLASSLPGVSQAQGNGGRKVLAETPTSSQLEEALSTLILIRGLPAATVDAAKDSLKGFASSVQLTLDDVCERRLDQEAAAESLAETLRGILAEVDLLDGLGSPAGDLELGLKGLFSSMMFPTQRFCTTPPDESDGGVPLGLDAIDVTGPLKDLIDELLREENRGAVAAVLVESVSGLLGSFEEFCASGAEDAGGAVAEGLLGLLKGLAGVSPELHHMLLDGASFVLRGPEEPGPSLSSMEQVKQRLLGLVEEGEVLMPLQEVCSVINSSSNSSIDGAEGGSCGTVASVCPFDPEELSSMDNLTAAKLLVPSTLEICAAPGCADAAASAAPGCLPGNVTGLLEANCGCYEALEPHCRAPAFASAPRAMLGMQNISTIVTHLEANLEPRFLEAVRLSSEAYCPRSDGSWPGCLTTAYNTPDCRTAMDGAALLPGSSNGGLWSELCCAANVLTEPSCVAMLRFFDTKRTAEDIMNGEFAEASAIIFASDRTLDDRAEHLSRRFGFGTFGDVLTHGVMYLCKLWGKFDSGLAATCIPKMNCIYEALAGVPIDAEKELKRFLNISAAACETTCAATVLEQCFDTPVTPYMAFFDAAAADNYTTVYRKLKDWHGGQDPDWDFVKSMVPLLEPMCSSKCQGALGVCGRSALGIYGLEYLGRLLSAVCHLSTEPPVTCSDVASACGVDPVHITAIIGFSDAPKSAGFALEDICAAPGCLDAIAASDAGCISSFDSRAIQDVCACYDSVEPQCRGPLFAFTNRDMRDLRRSMSQFTASRGEDLNADLLIAIVNSRRSNVCPTQGQSGGFSSCLSNATPDALQTCSSLYVRSTLLRSDRDLKELCCISTLFSDSSCFDMYRTFSDEKAVTKALEHGGAALLFDSSWMKASTRAEKLKSEYGVETVGDALEVSKDHLCTFISQELPEDDATETCLSRMECLQGSRDASEAIRGLMDADAALCGANENSTSSGGCFQEAMEACSDAPLEPYLSYMDRYMAEPTLMFILGLQDRLSVPNDSRVRDFVWSVLEPLVLTLEPICSSKCHAAINSCNDPAMKILRLHDLAKFFSGMCAVIQEFGADSNFP